MVVVSGRNATGSSGRLKAFGWALGLTVLAVAIVLWLPVTDAVYRWVKAFHVIAVIAWMAGLLYLPRLFVYHCAAGVGSEQSETFKVMERRLLGAIMNPAMVVSWTLGLWMVFSGQWGAAGWFHVKLSLVVALTLVHMLLARWVAEFGSDRNRHSGRFFRIMNEVPTVLMMAIVIFVVVKPLD